MSFKVERSHVIFKHLIHVGPEIDVEAVSEIAVSKDYTKNTRQIPTPSGPLNEYMFRPKNNPQSLIVFSSKGFVIETQPSDNVLTLFRDAYDFYEKVLGDTVMTVTALMEINSMFEVFSPISVKEMISKTYTEKIPTLTYNQKSLYPHGITLAYGSGKFPDEFIQIIIQPLVKDPERRLAVTMIYHSTELDEALKFTEKAKDDLVELLEKIINV